MALYKLSPDDDDVQRRIADGSLTAQDVIIMSSAPDPMRSPFLGLNIGGVSSFVIRQLARQNNLKLTPVTRILTSIPICAATGGYLGHLQSQAARRKQLESLQNPEGYRRAIMDIHKERALKVGEELIHFNWTYGIVLGQKIHPRRKVELDSMDNQPLDSPGVNEDDGRTDEQSLGENPPINHHPPTSTDAGVLPTSHQLPVPQAQSTRWEEIRKERANAQPTVWDLIRQKHEKESIPATTDGSQPKFTDEPFQPTGDSQQDDEKSEQEKFDALVEAERRASSESPDAYGNKM